MTTISENDGVLVMPGNNPMVDFDERSEALEQRIRDATAEIARQAFDAAQGDPAAAEQVKKLRAEIDTAQADLQVLQMAGTEAERRAQAEALKRSEAERAAYRAEGREQALKAIAEAEKCQEAIEAFGASRLALHAALKACNIAMHKAGEPLPDMIGANPQYVADLAGYELRRLDTPFMEPRPLDGRVKRAMARLLEHDQ